MNDLSQLAVTGVTVAVLVATALLVWSLSHIGSQGLARYRVLFTERTNVGLRELFLFIDPSRLYLANLALILLVAPLVWLLAGSVVPAIVVAAVAAFGPRFLMRWLRRRRMERLEQQLPDTLLTLAGEQPLAAAPRLYEQAAKAAPVDAVERLDADLARAELAG